MSPVTWLSLESTCDMALEAAKKSACTFTDWSADLGGLVQTSPFLQSPSQQKTPSAKVTPAEELAKLNADNKWLREEITKQMLANKKAKGQTTLLTSTPACTVFLCRNQCRLVWHACHYLCQ